MFEVVKLQMEDLRILADQKSNAHVADWLASGKAKAWVESPEAFSGFVHGQLMISVGMTKYWEGRAHIWSIFSEQAEHHFISVFRGMQKFMESQQPYRRVEMDVPLGMTYTPLAQRRAILLGFKLECAYAKNYRPNGGDSALYSWTRGAN